MLSPFMTVLVLVVLWLIVVVPMVLRRNDERRRDRLGRRVGTRHARTRTPGRRGELRRSTRPRCSSPAAASRPLAALATPPPRARRPGGADVPARPFRALRGADPDADAPSPVADHPRRRQRRVHAAGAGDGRHALWCSAAAVPARLRRLPAGSCAARPERPRPAREPPAARRRPPPGRLRRHRGHRPVREADDPRSCASTTTTSSCTAWTPSTFTGLYSEDEAHGRSRPLAARADWSILIP